MTISPFEIIMWSVLAFTAVWFIIGCAVLAAIDDDNQSLFNWAKRAPYPFLYELVVLSWPILLWMWWKKKKG